MNNSMKILLISSRADFGGGPEHLYQLVKHLSKDTIPYIACPKDFPYWDKYSELIGKENLIEIPHRELSAGAIFELISFIEKNNIKIIHSHGRGAGFYSRLLKFFTGCSVIHSFHGVHYDKRNFILKFIFVSLEKIFNLMTDKFICTSGSEKSKVLNFKLCPENKTELIVNGIEIPEKININNHSSENKYILSFLRFAPEKNPELLINIFENIKKARDIKLKMILIGGGELLELCKKLAREKGLQDSIDFPGTVCEPKKYYHDAFCFLSSSRGEGMPLTLLEAMSFGIPVIASDVAGNNDLIEHNETGFLYKLHKYDEATDNFFKLIDNKNLYEKISLNSINLVKNNFDINMMAHKIENLYTKIIKI